MATTNGCYSAKDFKVYAEKYYAEVYDDNPHLGPADSRLV
jgi:hypothetical protein